MIRLNELIPVATVNKTHGIHGELSMSVDSDVALDKGCCLITPIEGIPVPFFVSAVRRRSVDTFLVKLDGVDSDAAASEFQGVTFYAEPTLVVSDENEEADDNADSEGFYASMLIDSKLVDTDGTEVGIIKDIDDSTSNVLLIVEQADESTVMVPLAIDLITEFNPEEGVLTMNIPVGLLDMQ